MQCFRTTNSNGNSQLFITRKMHFPTKHLLSTFIITFLTTESLNFFRNLRQCSQTVEKEAPETARDHIGLLCIITSRQLPLDFSADGECSLYAVLPTLNIVCKFLNLGERLSLRYGEDNLKQHIGLWLNQTKDGVRSQVNKIVLQHTLR